MQKGKVKIALLIHDYLRHYFASSRGSAATEVADVQGGREPTTESMY